MRLPVRKTLVRVGVSAVVAVARLLVRAASRKSAQSDILRGRELVFIGFVRSKVGGLGKEANERDHDVLLPACPSPSRSRNRGSHGARYLAPSVCE